MSATDGFADLPYSEYPAVDSDVRYIYRDIQLDDIQYITQFESLLAAVKSASTTDDRAAAWATLEAFRSTSEYITYVEPVLNTAMKMQRIEDCLLACQRIAKRQKQQWVVSNDSPSDNVQLVNDIWFKPNGLTTDNITNHLMYQKTANGYSPMIIQNPSFDVTEIKLVTELPSDASSHPTTLYLIAE